MFFVLTCSLSGFKEIEINKKLIIIGNPISVALLSLWSIGDANRRRISLKFVGYKFPLHQMLCQWNQCFIPVCTEKEYHCDNDRCLTPRQVCDGTEDCRDGADESDCGKKYKLVNKSTLRICQLFKYRRITPHMLDTRTNIILPKLMTLLIVNAFLLVNSIFWLHVY